jgi:hypothetical protein
MLCLTTRETRTTNLISQLLNHDVGRARVTVAWLAVFGRKWPLDHHRVGLFVLQADMRDYE